ncbi:hypothetical protein [Actinopolyspora xinjiangensis]|uniref:hypothetical protein n=1 Tax=Actinopolyspora xinjiangensis TaxID=405564 RepID=UPI0014816D49|nr:hypothetical protein [Actinopolyspora xinjiangensis]
MALLVWWIKESPAEAASAVRQGLEMLRQAAESVRVFLEQLPSLSSLTSQR